MTKLNLLGVLGLTAAIAAGVSTCGGGVTTAMDTRESARDKTTTATCDRYQACGLIGPDANDTYATYDSCMITWKANWEQSWPAASCATINQSGLSVCMSAIGATDCANFLDFLATLGKCQAVDVCNQPPTDGGGG